MSAHTPGPWLIDTEDRDICVQLPNGEWLEVATVGCMDHNGIKYWFGPESWANACVLRTAPELLEALEQARKYVAFAFDQGIEGAEKAGLDLDAAIAKARGKS